MFDVQNLHKTYTISGVNTNAVNGIDLHIDDGEFVAIVGKSGSGKTTLMHMLGGLLLPTSGTILMNGHSLGEMSRDELASYRNRETGFVFQSFNLEMEYTVYDNVRLPLLIQGIKWDEHQKLIENALKLVEMDHKIKSKASHLSGGEQQRVAIARAIVTNASTIFADEPCGNLDSVNSSNIMNLLKKLHQSGKTIIMVTHDSDDANCANRVIEIADGKIVRDETKS